MERSISIIFLKSALPSVAAWNKEIARAGFDVELGSFEWEMHPKLWPVRMRSACSEVEMSFAQVGPVSVMVAMTANDSIAFLAAACAGVVLQRLTGGTLRDDGPEPVDPAERMKDVRRAYFALRLVEHFAKSAEPTLSLDQPPLDRSETAEERAEVLSLLLDDHVLISEAGDETQRFRMNKYLQTRLLDLLGVH